MNLFPNIKKYSKIKDFTYFDLLKFLIESLPFALLVAILSISLAYTNHFYDKDNLKQQNKLYTSEFTVNDFTILNPKDSYFYDINLFLDKAISVEFLLRKLNLNEIIESNLDFNDYKIVQNIEFNEINLEERNNVDFTFTLSSNFDSIKHQKFIKYFESILVNFSYQELEKLFQYKINTEERVIVTLEEQFTKKQDFLQRQIKMQKEIQQDITKDNKIQRENLRNKLIERRDEINNRIFKDRAKLITQIAQERFEFVEKYYKNMQNSEIKKYLEEKNFFEYEILNHYIDLGVTSNKGQYVDLLPMLDLEDLGINTGSSDLLNSSDFDSNGSSGEFPTQLLDLNIESAIMNQINSRGLDMNLLQSYLEKIRIKQDNLIYYNDISFVSKNNFIDMQHYIIAYVIISLFLSILLLYIILLVRYLINSNSKSV